MIDEKIVFDDNSIKHLTKKIMDSIPNNISEIENDKEYVTEEYVQKKIKEVINLKKARGRTLRSKNTIIDNSDISPNKTWSSNTIEKNIVENNKEVRWLKLSPAYNFKIDNTIDSVTREMIIKGRTLQNLCSLTATTIGKGWVDKGNSYSLVQEPKAGQSIITYQLTKTLKPNTTYTIVMDLPRFVSGKIHCSFVGTSSTKLASIGEITHSNAGLFIGKLTTVGNEGERATHFRFFNNNDSKFDMDVSKKILILEEDLTQEILPSYFEGIQSVGEKENKVEIASCGKNLYKDAQSKIVLKKGSKYKLTSSQTPGGKRLYITNMSEGDIVASKFYYNSHNKCYNLRADMEIIDDIITCNRDCEIILTTHLSQFASYIPYKNLQLENGIEATSYEPYIESRRAINFPEEVENGLKGVEKVHDEIVMKEDGIYLVQKFNKRVVNGSEKWGKSVYASHTKVMRFALTISDNLALIGGAKMVCDNFNPITTTTKDEEGILISKDKIFINIDKTKIVPQDENGLKSWLGENNTTIYYELAEPVEHKLLDITDINLNTYKGITYITSNNNIDPTLSMSIPMPKEKAIQTIIEDGNITSLEVDRINNQTLQNVEELNKINSILDLAYSLTEVNTVIPEGGKDDE